MIPGNSPGHWLPDIKRYVRPIDGFAAPDIADPLPPGERPKDFEIPPAPDFDRPVKPGHEKDLFLALADPHASLIDVANEFKVSLEALSVWMVRPDIAARLESIAEASVVRARFVAKSFLPAAARTAGRILALHQIVRRHNPKSLARDSNNERRFDKTAIQAGILLARLATFGEKPPPRKTGSPPQDKASAQSPAQSPSQEESSQTAPPQSAESPANQVADFQSTSLHDGAREPALSRSLSKKRRETLHASPRHAAPAIAPAIGPAVAESADSAAVCQRQKPNASSG
ncbi:MAG: hypothetical protein KF691_12495 [Phycisphaeraceae bacterium]|nr:hypothetical protein [Phycisphaeraceae bacterium]